MKKSIIKTIIAIGFFVFVLGAIIDPVMKSSAAAFIVGNVYIAVAAILGTAFVFSKNTTLANVGYGLCAVIGAFGVTFMMHYASYPIMVTSVGLIIMLVGAVLQFLLIAIKFFGFIKSEDKQTVGDVSAILTHYKELEKEKVISEEEFNGLKAKVIAANENDKVSLEDLKKWKKLLDQGIIDETEFSNMKSKLFNK